MADGNTREFNESNFEAEVLQSSQPVLVDFWAEWCPPCKALGPTIDELAIEYAGRVTVGKVNTDDNQSLSARYGISNIPTVLLFQGGEIKQRLGGLRRKADFKAMLDAILTTATA